MFLIVVMTFNKKNTNDGFAVLYAVLVASVIAIGGLILSNIIFKQLVLSGVGQSSQISYYAADVGRACARYWQVQGNFGYVEDNYDTNTRQFNKIEVGEINCFSSDISITPIEDTETVGNPEAGKWQFTVENINGNSCAKVAVSNNLTKFSLESLGYNNPTCESTNRLVLRRVKNSNNNN